MMHDRHDRLINRQVLYFKPSYWWNVVKNVKEKTIFSSTILPL